MAGTHGCRRVGWRVSTHVGGVLHKLGYASKPSIGPACWSGRQGLQVISYQAAPRPPKLTGPLLPGGAPARRSAGR